VDGAGSPESRRPRRRAEGPPAWLASGRAADLGVTLGRRRPGQHAGKQRGLGGAPGRRWPGRGAWETPAWGRRDGGAARMRGWEDHEDARMGAARMGRRRCEDASF